MKVDRRDFLKGLMGSGLIVLSGASIKPSLETVEERIQRLFSRNTMNIKPAALSVQRDSLTLELREPDDLLREVSDKTFIEMIDRNIRRDFSEGSIVTLAGWQLAQTEIAVLTTISRAG